MTFSVCFIMRREIVSPSIERVFQTVAKNLEVKGIETMFARVPFGDGIAGTLLNLAFFRPPKADLLHITGHINFLGLVLPRDKTISTVHDLIILNFRSGLRRWFIEKLLFVWPTRRLRFLTAISDLTKKRLVKLANVAPEKIRVIQNPLLVSRSPKGEFKIPKTRILQVGTAPYKNVERTVSAISGLSCELQIIGNLSDELRQHLDDCRVPFFNEENLDDRGIEGAYENADILTLCSTDEGFGLPIIEAQAKQTVVVTSDRPPMKDVAGEGAVLVDPESVASIRAGILQVIGDPILREEIVGKGLRNIERFDPAKIAADYLALYETVLTDQRN